MSIFDGMKIVVTAHSMQRFTERFPALALDRPVAYQIEREVRIALNEGRISATQPHKAADSGDPTCVYTWTENGERVYSLRHDESPPQFVVTTTMKPEFAVL